MRAIVQLVSRASVAVNQKEVGSIGLGLLVFLGVHKADGEEDINYIVQKIKGLRVFEDVHGQMNLSLKEVGGSILLVSQFTLYGDARKGNRPSYSEAAKEDLALEYYQRVGKLLENDFSVAYGQFKAMMEVSLINEGPVTIMLDSSKNF